MQNYLSLKTVHEKIIELQTALFYDLSNSIMKLPVSVINVLNVDELGQIWFAIPLHFHYLQEYDKDFLSELHFFRKSKDFYLNITGKAYWVHDPEEINHTYSIPDELKKMVLAKEFMLLKIKIRTADYFERKSHSAKKKDYKSILYQLYSGLFTDSQANYFNYRVLHLEQ